MRSWDGWRRSWRRTALGARLRDPAGCQEVLGCGRYLLAAWPRGEAQEQLLAAVRAWLEEEVPKEELFLFAAQPRGGLGVGSWRVFHVAGAGNRAWRCTGTRRTCADIKLTSAQRLQLRAVLQPFVEGQAQAPADARYQKALVPTQKGLRRALRCPWPA